MTDESERMKLVRASIQTDEAVTSRGDDRVDRVKSAYAELDAWLQANTDDPPTDYTPMEDMDVEDYGVEDGVVVECPECGWSVGLGVLFRANSRRKYHDDGCSTRMEIGITTTSPP